MARKFAKIIRILKIAVSLQEPVFLMAAEGPLDTDI
jgi:hypothetical protein